MNRFLIFFFLITTAFSQEFNFHPKLNSSHNKLIKKYDKVLRQYKKKFCEPDLEKKYDALFTDYQGNGIYVPYLNNEIDIDTIKKNLYLLKSKKRWIQSKRNRLKKYVRLPSLDKGLVKLEKLVEENLKVKYEFDVLGKKDRETIKKGKRTFAAIRDFYIKFEQKFFYMHNFGYPVNHRENRRAYELAKAQDIQKRMNQTFFRRKIYEDGAPSSSVYKKDTFPRTIIDTIKREILKKQIFVSNSLQYDIEWLLTTLPKARRYGIIHYKNAFKSWEEKVSEMLRFYSGILNKNDKDRKFASLKLQATEAIKKYVNSRLGKVYDYWTDQEEIYRSMFALETILFNEVGALDPSGKERKEVVDVVLNRYHSDTYNKLDPKQDLVQYIETKNTNSYKWLNVFLKEREFSFTYYFIPAVINIFCPPRTKWAKQLRKSNLRLSLKALRNYEVKPKSQQAIRYFSRASMIGRIDMAPVWSNHKQMPEKLGKRIKKADDILQSIDQKKFKYRYSFMREGQIYNVFKVQGQKYAIANTSKGRKVYRYRDPHFFRFFSL